MQTVRLSISQETTNRQQADALETLNRENGDASLAAAISDESFLRAAGDSNLQTQIFFN